MLLDAYREVYFTGGVSSVYLWDLEDATEGGGGAAAGSFAGCFLILKRVGGGEGEGGSVGSWESFHVVQVGHVCVSLRHASLALNSSCYVRVW